MTKKINNRLFEHPPSLVAELGCNHLGDMEIAKSMVDALRETPLLEIIKFQKREISPETIANFNEPHPCPENSFGDTYGLHKQALEFDIEQHRELKAYIEKSGHEYMASVWDLRSAKEISGLNPKHIKIPSAKNKDFELLEAVVLSGIKNIHISLGMLDPTSADDLIAKSEELQRSSQNIIFYSCVSGYPTPPEESCLLDISRLKKRLEEQVDNVMAGFSAHHLGAHLDIAGFVLGAQWIERHITLDRAWKGTDQKLSLLPEEFSKLGQQLKDVEKALSHRPQQGVLPIEKSFAAKLGR